jgi:hypothetical protein
LNSVIDMRVKFWRYLQLIQMPYLAVVYFRIVIHQSGLFRCFFLFIKIRCITIKDIAARALGDVMVASHELRFVLPRMLASLLKKRHARHLTVEAASRGVLAMCVHGFTFCIEALRCVFCVGLYVGVCQHVFV